MAGSNEVETYDFRYECAGKRVAGYHNGKPVEELFIHAEVIL